MNGSAEGGEQGRWPGPDAETARLQVVNEQLQTALRTRIVIEQAKGILAERLALSLEDAFAVLRRAARSTRTPLRDLALAVVADLNRTPESILETWRPTATRHEAPTG